LGRIHLYLIFSSYSAFQIKFLIIHGIVLEFCPQRYDVRNLLATHLDWRGSRLDVLARFILAVLQVRSVNLTRLAPVLSSRAKPSSNDIRLQRFMRSFTMDQSDITRTVGDLLHSQQPWVLTFDRINWKLGRAEINLLVLGVAYRGLVIPLLWTILPKAGNSSAHERIALMERFFVTFPGQPVAFLLADCEFVGRDWPAYLLRRELPFRLRLKANANLTSLPQRGPTHCCANSRP